MRERTVELKVLSRQFCYKEVKAASNSNLMLPKEAQITPDCPWGYKVYGDICSHCKWQGEEKISIKVIGEMKKTEGEK